MLSLEEKLLNKPFVSEFEKPITEEDHIYYRISSKILKKHDLDGKIKFVTPLKSVGNYDSFSVNCGSESYILKISLDHEDPLLTNESLFYKNNKHETLCEYVDSGIIKVGDKIMFLLIKDELGLNLNDAGISSVLKSAESFLFTLALQKNLVATSTIDTYIEKIYKDIDINSLSEATISSMKQYQDVEKTNRVIDECKKNIETERKKQHIKGFDFCHGDLGPENVTSLNNLYRFCDFGNCFYGNQFIDIAMLCLNLGYEERDFNDICRKYCLLLEFDYESKKKEFRECLSLAYSVFILRLIYDFVIEQCVYENSREDKIIWMVKKFEDSSWAFRKTNLENWCEIYLKEVFKKTVDFDKEIRKKHAPEPEQIDPDPTKEED